MKKTSLYIDPDVDRALSQRAAAEGLTKAEMIRRDTEGPRRRPAAVGIFDGPRDLSAEVDRHLDETGFGDR